MSVAKLANHDKDARVKRKGFKASAMCGGYPRQISVPRMDYDNMLASVSCE